MELLGQFLIDNWEVISVIFGGSGALGVGGYKGFKAAQKQRDSGQDARIKKNSGDINILKNDVVELKSQNKSIKMSLDQNYRDDISFREKWEAKTDGIQKTLSDFMERFFQMRDDDQTKKIDKLEKTIEKLRNGD